MKQVICIHVQILNAFLDDETRVSVAPIAGVPGSDYINASYINVSIGIQLA